MLAGCGGAVAPDLFEIRRSGTIPGARLDLVVKDDGRVSCNRKPFTRLPDQLVLDAREIARVITEKQPPLRSVAPGPGTVLRYVVRLPDQTLAFSDTSRPLPQELVPVQGFTRSVAKDVCGLPR
jgi:hypothetical protein